MSNLIKVIKATFLLLLLLVFSSCSSNSSHNKILGTWKASVFIDADKAKSIFDLEDERDIELEATIVSTESFLRGNRYNGEGEMTIRVFSNNQEISLKLYIRESGSWELHEEHLVIISEDSKVTAADEITRELVESDPDFLEMLKPVKGESTSSEIISISETNMQMKPEDWKGILVNYEKG